MVMVEEEEESGGASPIARGIERQQSRRTQQEASERAPLQHTATHTHMRSRQHGKGRPLTTRTRDTRGASHSGGRDSALASAPAAHPSPPSPPPAASHLPSAGRHHNPQPTAHPHPPTTSIGALYLPPIPLTSMNGQGLLLLAHSIDPSPHPPSPTGPVTFLLIQALPHTTKAFS